MNTKSLAVFIEVSQSPNHVFNSIQEVPKWWSRDFEGSSRNLNDEFTICHPGQHYSRQKLVEVIPDRKIVWHVTESTLDWLQSDKQEWTDTKMIFEIKAIHGKTLLHFTHEGLSPNLECYAMCEKGWNTIIREWLLHFITQGTEAPEMTKAAEIRRQLLAEKNK